MFCGPLVIKAFAYYLNSINGSILQPDDDDDLAPIEYAQGALALSAAAVVFYLYNASVTFLTR